MRSLYFLLPVFAVLSVGAFAETEARWDQCLGHGFPFVDSGREPTMQYGRGRPIDIQHIKLEVAIDFDQEMVSGVATHTFVPVAEPVTEVDLDAVDLDVSRVVDGSGADLDFETTDEKLNIFLAKPAAPGVESSVAVHYSAKPYKGLHFRTERMGYTALETQAWTQGESEDNRHWFPCYDYPNERASTEIIVTVPAEFMALSNGNLIETSKDQAAGTKTYHWLQEQPHASYLVSLLAGHFSEIKAQYGDLDLYYYVLPGFEEQARLAFGKTADMVRFFEEKIGVKYPWPRYSQVAVVDFVAGGMENTGITTVTERTLNDSAARLTADSDSLVSHELAHQWFGDLLTCRDWSHLWLNEGFATYFQALYFEDSRGIDDFVDDMLDKLPRVINGDTGDQRAPIVRKKYGSPDDLFDFRCYNKGGWVLHMLRRELGDELFWKCMNAYVVGYRGQAVETNDLMRTIEEVSGRSMERFFDQWVYHGGYPQLKVAYSWDNAHKTAKVSVVQTQKVDEKTPIFHFKTELVFAAADQEFRKAVEITEKEQSFQVPLKWRPEYVRFDPNHDILKTMEFDKPKPMLLAQLEHDPAIAGRYQALDQLTKFKTKDVVDAMAKVLKQDPFWGARAKAATALGKVEHDDAVKVLLDNADESNPRVRQAIMAALGKSKDPRARRVLMKVIGEEPSPQIVAEAIRSLGRQKYQPAVKVITAALDRDSHTEMIRNAAFGALANLEAQRSLDTILPYLAPGKPRMCARAAISAVGEVGSLMNKKNVPREALVARLDDPRAFVRRAALEALAELGDEKAIGDIESFIETAKDSEEINRAENTVTRIKEQRAQTAEVRTLRQQVDDLKKKSEAFEKQLKAIEERLKPAAGQQDDKAGGKENSGSDKAQPGERRGRGERPGEGRRSAGRPGRNAANEKPEQQ